MRGYLICFFLNLFVCVYATGQKIFTISPPATQEPADSLAKNAQSPFIPFKGKLNLSSPNNTRVYAVPEQYYFNSLGFFCQKELQIEKTLKFPVKFRLGSVTYTDQMEGKGKGQH